MSSNDPSQDDVVRYLRANPAFLVEHPELLVGMSVPSTHGGRAISLHERQLEVLRDKNRLLEQRIAELVRNGRDNDATLDRLSRWVRLLLCANDEARLPQIVVESMLTLFGVPQVALRLWGVLEPYAAIEAAAPVSAEAITLAQGLKAIYCGSNADFPAATWLPDGGTSARSIALLALRRAPDTPAFGMLVLGSPDPARFHAGIGTAYLERIGDLAGAALARLVE